MSQDSSQTALVFTVASGLIAAGGIFVRKTLQRRRTAHPLQEAAKAESAGDTQRAINLLENILAEGATSDIRLRLALLYEREGCYADAATQFTALCAETATNTPENHLRLSSCLDALGDLEGRERERQHAVSVLHGTEFATPAVLALGQRFAEEGRSTLAALVYGMVLSQERSSIYHIFPTLQARVLAKCSSHLLLSGSYQTALLRTEQLLAIDKESLYFVHANAMASHACTFLHRFPDSEAFAMRGLAAAQDSKDAEGASRALAQLAQLRLYQGHIEDALNAAQQALTFSIAASESVSEIRAQIMMLRGQYGEIEALFGSRTDTPLPRLEGEPPSLAVSSRRFLLFVARMEMNRPDEALDALKRIEPIFRAEPRRRFLYDAARLWAEAQRHPASPAIQSDIRTLAITMHHRAIHYGAESLTALRQSIALTARAAFAAGDHLGALNLLSWYRRTVPLPVYMPSAWYYSGLSHEALGDTNKAILVYRNATAPRIDTADTRLAQQRLDILEGEKESVRHA